MKDIDTAAPADAGMSGTPEEILAKLAEEFPADAHQQRRAPGGGPELTYISIDQTIKRLNEVLGPQWRTEAKTNVSMLEGDSTTYLAVTELVLTANVGGVIKAAYGVGAMVNRDPDMAAKTALAEAIKKAGHQYGIGLYLWDDTTRAKVEKKMALAGASDAKLKAAVYDLARDALGKTKPTIAEVAKLFGRKAEDMTEPDVNRTILKEQGLL